METMKHLSLAAKAAVVALFAMATGVGARAQSESTNSTREIVPPSNDTNLYYPDNLFVPSEGEDIIIVQDDEVRHYIRAPKPVEGKRQTWEEFQKSIPCLFIYHIPDYGHGSVEVERKGNLLIAIEPEEPEL